MSVIISDRSRFYDELMLNVKPKLKNALRPFYEKSKTIREFVNCFLDSHDCYILQTWVEEYVLRFLPYIVALTWSIEHDPKFRIEIEALSERPKDLFGMGLIPAGYFNL